MLVQYLVGLCCLRRHPAAVDITLGDMVLDLAAGKERDVDITVTIEEGAGVKRAFKAYEVKREGTPLDVATVEQLCMKLLDMPSVTHRAIVSASGYTEAAHEKAASHGVELYELSPWSGRFEDAFPNLGLGGTPEEALPLDHTLLVWIDYKIDLVASQAPAAFSVRGTDPVLSSSGDPHPRYRTLGDFENEVLLRSTEILLRLWPADTVSRIFPRNEGPDSLIVSPAWPHTHTLDVSGDDIYFGLSQGRVKLELVTISGRLRWETRGRQGQYYLMRRQSDGEIFAGAVIALGKREGQMYGIVASPASTSMGIHIIRLEDKHLNAIRNLKLKMAANSEPSE